MISLVPLPNLDDRRWADLVEEGRGLIPVYGRSWTDHNVHDPGVTLMELFAWIAEMDLYQLNRIPEKHRRKFLALIGIRPAPPIAARAVLSFALNPRHVRRLPATTEFQGLDAFNQPAPFRTLEDLNVVGGELKVIKLKDQNGWHDLTDRWQRREPFHLFGDGAQPGAELHLGFSKRLPHQVPAALFFTVMEQLASDQERARLIQEISKSREACRPIIRCDNASSAYTAQTNESSLEPLTHHSVRTVWEAMIGQNHWQRLKATAGEIRDETRAFTLNGKVQVCVPLGTEADPPGAGQGGLYYLRCRFVAGAYDAPPLLQNLVLNGVLAEQAIPVGVQDPMAPDPVEVQSLAQGTGRSNQRLVLPTKPVQEDSFELYTKENGNRRNWLRRDALDASQPADLHYLLDSTEGIVTFGDGRRGRLVPPNAQISASFRATRAEAGNLAAATINQLADTPHNRQLLQEFDKVKNELVKITNPLPAVGGAAAETLEGAAARAFEVMTRPNRAVTLKDYETLAKETPGVRLARASARANLHPNFPCFQAPGMITVIVLPFLPAKRPMPSCELLSAVARFLDRRRVIGTRVQVVGPTYREVAVKAKVQAFPGLDKVELQRRIITALDRFFDPLPSEIGPGWQFGRDIYRSEVLQVLDATPGADYVVSLELIADVGEPQCGNICLGPLGLVAAGQHQIEIVGGAGCPT